MLEIVVITTLTSIILFTLDSIFRRVLPRYFHGTRESSWVLPVISFLYITSFLTFPPTKLPSIHRVVIITCVFTFVLHVKHKRIMAAVMMVIQACGQLTFEFRDTKIGMLPAFLFIPVYFVGGSPRVTVTWWGRNAFAKTADVRALALTWMYWYLSTDVSSTLYRHNIGIEGSMEPLIIVFQAIYVKSFIENAI
eukprot:PhF_6_TR10672/c0_g1_i1/m.17252